MNRTVKPVVVDAGASRIKVVLECPRCYWMFEAERPDDLHRDSSFEKPQKSNVKFDVIEQNFVCRNPKCKKAFIVYWSKPGDYFTRI